MGRNKFGPQRGPWRDHDWRGWWGDEPPFHFVDTDPASALEGVVPSPSGVIHHLFWRR
jgi:hypothetical protein